MCVTYNPLKHKTFIYVSYIQPFDTWDIHVCDIEHSCVWQWTFMCVKLNIHVCDIEHSCVWHSTFMCVTLHIHVCDIEHSCVWHWTFMCVTLNIHTMPRLDATTHSHVCRDSFTRVPGLIRMNESVAMCVAACCSMLQCAAVCCSATHNVWHDSFMCGPWVLGCHSTHSSHDSLGVTRRIFQVCHITRRIPQVCRITRCIPECVTYDSMHASMCDTWLDAFLKCAASLDAFLKCAASLDAFLNVWHMTRCIPQVCHRCIPQACHMCHTLLVLQCIVACCSVVRCVAMCCGVLQCVAVCCSAMHNVCPHSCVCGQHMVSCGAHMVSHIVWHILSYPSVSPCICCMRCSVLQCVAVPHMVSHSCVIPCLWSTYVNWCIDSNMPHVPRMMYVAVCCSVLQCVAVCRSTLPCVVMRRKCVTSLMYVRGILNSYTLACVAQGHMSWLIVYVCDMTHTWLDMTHTYVWPHSMKCGCNPPFVA